MAGSCSDYLEGQILDHVCGGTTFAHPATVYLGLWTTTLTDASTGSSGTEVSGGSYARVAVTNNTTNFPNASGGSKSNNVAQNFPTASGSWGTVTHAAICDAATVGNILYWFDLTASKTIGSGDTASFAIGAIVLTQT